MKIYLRQWETIATKELSKEIEKNRHSKTKRVDECYCISDQLKFKDVETGTEVVKIPSQVACRAQHKDDCGKNPERSIEIWLVSQCINKSTPVRVETQFDSFSNFLLGNLEKLLVELKLAELGNPSWCLCLLGMFIFGSYLLTDCIIADVFALLYDTSTFLNWLLL